MKLIVVILVALASTVNGCYSSEEQKAKTRTITRQCIKETGVDNNLLLQTRIGVFADDQKLKEVLFCLFANAGFQNPEGVLQEDVIRSQFDCEPTALQAFVPCFGETGENGPEIAFKVYKCFRNNLPENLRLAL